MRRHLNPIVSGTLSALSFGRDFWLQDNAMNLKNTVSYGGRIGDRPGHRYVHREYVQPVASIALLLAQIGLPLSRATESGSD